MLVLSGINKSKLLIVNQRIRTFSMLPSDVLHVPFPVIHHPGIQSKTYRLYDGNGNGTELPNRKTVLCTFKKLYVFAVVRPGGTENVLLFSLKFCRDMGF